VAPLQPGENALTEDALSAEDMAADDEYVEETDFVWQVKPTLAYDIIYYCQICDVFGNQDHAGYKLNTSTGQKTEPWEAGHGGGGLYLLYDEKKDLYGYYSYSEGDQNFEMWSGADFLANLSWRANMLNAFRKIDSDKVLAMESEAALFYDISGAYTNDKYALAYGITFVSDDIYDVDEYYHLSFVYKDFDFIAMRLNDKWGILDKNGIIAAPFLFDDILLIDKETAFAKYGGKYGILDVVKTSENFMQTQ
jgi:hypothetical protein